MLKHHKRGRVAGLLTALLLVIGTFVTPVAAAANTLPRPAPEFTHTDADAWLNTDPISLRALRGRVVLIDFWTFDCWNCYRSFPWLHQLEARFAAQPFTVVGVHTPEFEHERQKSRLLDKVKEYELTHPIMIDNNFSYWNQVRARYWPSFYLVDKQGMIRATFVGRTNSGSSQAQQIEETIHTLLAE